MLKNQLQHKLIFEMHKVYLHSVVGMFSKNKEDQTLHVIRFWHHHNKVYGKRKNGKFSYE